MIWENRMAYHLHDGKDKKKCHQGKAAVGGNVQESNACLKRI